MVPFFDFTIGKEYFLNGSIEENYTLKNLLIWKKGIGVQSLIFTHWLEEFKTGFGIRPDFTDNKNRNLTVGNFELSFYRILYSRITH